MVRRSDEQLVDDIIQFIIDHRRDKAIALTDFCQSLGINSTTAKKWLELLWFTKAMCPDFDFDPESGIIKFSVGTQYGRYSDSEDTDIESLLTEKERGNNNV